MLPAALPAQGQSVGAGRVVRLAGGDTVAVPGIRVTLHQVGRDFSGPIDSVLTDGQGRFRLAFQPDTTAIYLASTNYAGIEYFSPPIHTNPARPDTALALVVSDTASTAPIEVASRHVVVGAPRGDGTREVVDLVTLRNRTPLTRIPGAEERPTWTTPLPASVLGFSVGQSDFSSEAVFLRGGLVEVFGPVTPGEKDLLLRYLLPADASEVPITFRDSVPILAVLLEEPDARVRGASLNAVDSPRIGERSYRRWTGTAAAGATLILEFPQPGVGPALYAAGLVGLVAFGLGLTTWLALRRRGPGPAPTAPALGVEALARDIALLDREHRAAGPPPTPAESAEYQRARAALVDRLERLLAEGRRAR